MDNNNTNVTETRTPFEANFRLVRSPIETVAGPSNPGLSNAMINYETQEMHDLIADPDENLTLQDVMREIKRLQIRINENEAQTRVPQNNTNRRLIFHEHAFDTTHGRYSQDIRNQRGSTLNYLTLKDAQNCYVDCYVWCQNFSLTLCLTACIY